MESSGSLKRAKAPGSVSQIASCLVDGCNADLSQCRDYHRRHKVCELHSKTPKVLIGGREQRFCQQCSRFHSLVEFDEVKRSCRKRLDGHNRRRRKPQPDLARNSGLLFSNDQGSRLLTFGTPQIYPSGVVSSSWGAMVKPENDVAIYNSISTLNSTSSCPESSSVHGYKGVNHHLQFMKSTEPPSVCQQHVEPDTRCSNQKIFSDGLCQVIHPDRALSLLSSRSAPAVTREVGFSPMVQPEPMSHHPSQFSSPNQFHFAPEVENKPTISESDSQVSSNATFQFQEMFQSAHEESSASGSHQTLTFLWE